MRDKKAKIARLALVIVALVSVVLGFLKIFSHFYSVYRLGPLDYVVAVGAMVGGLLVISKKETIPIIMICTAFLAFEVLKAVVDFRDFGDVSLCAIAIFCLAIPLVKYSKNKANQKVFAKA